MLSLGLHLGTTAKISVSTLSLSAGIDVIIYVIREVHRAERKKGLKEGRRQAETWRRFKVRAERVPCWNANFSTQLVSVSPLSWPTQKQGSELLREYIYIYTCVCVCVLKECIKLLSWNFIFKMTQLCELRWKVVVWLLTSLWWLLLSCKSDTANAKNLSKNRNKMRRCVDSTLKDTVRENLKRVENQGFCVWVNPALFKWLSSMYMDQRLSYYAETLWGNREEKLPVTLMQWTK